MKRALQLAKNGEGRVSPNPMVGAVVVANGTIIGEGFHAFFGGPHAEVNAIRSVIPQNQNLLKDSTIYVTLEPCSHFGKTPPCANLIIQTGIPRVVIGSLDPNPLVAGKGVKILEEAGINVVCGVLEKECLELNHAFMKAHSSNLPWISLKWAQSADGFIARYNHQGLPEPVKFSSPLSSVWMHRYRAHANYIIVGGNTQRIDNPQLTVRYWGADSPQKLVLHGKTDLVRQMSDLRKKGAISVLVEGGAKLLNNFISLRLFDEIRIEIADFCLHDGLPAPQIPSGLTLVNSAKCGRNTILLFRK